jgi:hypothetical protein
MGSQIYHYFFGTESSVDLRVVFNSQSSCLNFPSAGIIGLSHHAWPDIVFKIKKIVQNYTMH